MKVDADIAALFAALPINVICNRSNDVVSEINVTKKETDQMAEIDALIEATQSIDGLYELATILVSYIYSGEISDMPQLGRRISDKVKALATDKISWGKDHSIGTSRK